MEWEAPGIVLSVRAYADADAVVATFTETQGRHLGLARGGMSRRQAACWQPGNLVQLRWVGRLSDQLGSYTGEIAHAAAALAMDDALALATLCGACAVADSALPEREPHPRAFALLLGVVASLADPAAAVAALARFECMLLAELGYGIDLTRCAITGQDHDLAYVSPRTGRAVAAVAGEPWRARLLVLPAFLRDEAEAADWPALRDALRLTGHFLARDAFGTHNRPLPPQRVALYDRLVRMTLTDESHDA